MKTEALFRQDAYLRSCEARIIRVDGEGLLLDRTVFYPQGGGQAGDSGWLTLDDGTRLRIADTRRAKFDGSGPDDAMHMPDVGQDSVQARFVEGQLVCAEIDWERRYRHMRLHTAAHLLCAVLPFPVDGCSITADYARLDFVTSDPLARDTIDVALAELVARRAVVSIDTMTDAALEANPDLVRTMSVKPPVGTGRVRLVRVEGVDLQPCGGTHVANTSEVGAVRVARMEKKTARTRRVVLTLE
ncbi:Threonyl/alanyl tRNA synthetase SAD [Paraburkholderia ribeironis]|uniref:Alanine--tRNA ligase n=1 Tax=Paraburkholderia ribeironis TaxID=1247936 RepID=A0A1N7S8Z1_9BURK|nr:alanyl-tRNA editing protein [Paraburkholderia ribeironis]SIT43844.1 Threonyl/alanyl tRNA synthetase SAD [Paraburkholderia ribeironis]